MIEFPVKFLNKIYNTVGQIFNNKKMATGERWKGFDLNKNNIAPIPPIWFRFSSYS